MNLIVLFVEWKKLISVSFPITFTSHLSSVFNAKVILDLETTFLRPEAVKGRIRGGKRGCSGGKKEEGEKVKSFWIRFKVIIIRRGRKKEMVIKSFE